MTGFGFGVSAEMSRIQVFLIPFYFALVAIPSLVYLALVMYGAARRGP
ncbi:MAG: hypothetical protein ACREEC_07295 [Thermoplasmata archaeon]